MTIDQIKAHCNEAFRKGGHNFATSNIALSINGRLTKTQGRCISKAYMGAYYPEKIEISRQLLETGTEQAIIDVIYHECAHALVTIETAEPHGHDAVFKAVCQKIGATRDKASGYVERKENVAVDEIYKYTVYCPNCGFIGGYSKMGKRLKNINDCFCGKCNGGNLYYKQNW